MRRWVVVAAMFLALGAVSAAWAESADPLLAVAEKINACDSFYAEGTIATVWADGSSKGRALFAFQRPDRFVFRLGDDFLLCDGRYHYTNEWGVPDVEAARELGKWPSNFLVTGLRSTTPDKEESSFLWTRGDAHLEVRTHGKVAVFTEGARPNWTEATSVDVVGLRLMRTEAQGRFYVKRINWHVMAFDPKLDPSLFTLCPAEQKQFAPVIEDGPPDLSEAMRWLWRSAMRIDRARTLHAEGVYTFESKGRGESYSEEPTPVVVIRGGLTRLFVRAGEQFVLTDGNTSYTRGRYSAGVSQKPYEPLAVRSSSLLLGTHDVVMPTMLERQYAEPYWRLGRSPGPPLQQTVTSHGGRLYVEVVEHQPLDKYTPWRKWTWVIDRPTLAPIRVRFEGWATDYQRAWEIRWRMVRMDWPLPKDAFALPGVTAPAVCPTPLGLRRPGPARRPLALPRQRGAVPRGKVAPAPPPGPMCAVCVTCEPYPNPNPTPLSSPGCPW